VRLQKLLTELRAEITGPKTVVINGKKYNIDQLTGLTKKIISDVLRYIGKNLPAFTKYDLTNWDIQTFPDGNVKVTDDKGRSWKYKGI